MAKQSIFGRISQLVRANINALIDQAEDPQMMLDQMVRDYTNSIADAEAAIAETIGNLRLLEDDHREDVEAAREWGEKALAHYAKLRIDAHTKRLVFSDGLDLERAFSLYRHFADRTQLGFGIGTNLSNDVGLQPLNIVMKLTHCNGQPVAKLSDSPGKTLCDDQTFLAYLRQVFNVAS